MATKLTVPAPKGSHFAYEVVRAKKGAQDLGEVPILVWDDLTEAFTYYTEEGILTILDGTSVRVSMQSIARRMRINGKSDDEIAKAQVDFRPGTKAVGVPTPVSRAARAARKAAEALGGESGDMIAALLDKVAKGEISPDELASLTA